MKRGHLSDYFEGVGVKQLSAVDAEPKTSNQHEIGTTKKMREQFLGESHKFEFSVTFIWLGDNYDTIILEEWATHYDARINKPRAPEWRLYYPSNPVTEIMKPGDTLFLAKTHSGHLHFIVAPSDSTSESQLCWLFDLKPEGKTFHSRELSISETELDFTKRLILGELGIEVNVPEDTKLDRIVDQYWPKFPPTKEFSQIARNQLAESINVFEDPDTALVLWIEYEEELFRHFESRLVSSRLKQGFVTDNDVDVDGFIKYSLGVHNRRKSRMGYALENHIAAVLDFHQISYERGAVTEHKKKPDFLFPSLEKYKSFPKGDALLTMLGAKSTCKDRWRQVLVEADKIPHKHLLTLEAKISVPQTDEMKFEGIQLVVPNKIRETYTQEQKKWVWSVKDFINYVAEKQTQLSKNSFKSQFL